jgi:hypothetical protein
LLGKGKYWRLRKDFRLRVARPFTPSFSRFVEHDIRVLKLVAKNNDADPFALWPFMAKGHGIRQTVESIGLGAPRVLHGPVPSTEVPWGDLPSSFVIKPSTGTASRGVFLMRRTDDHRFHDLIKGQLWTAEELVSQYQQLPSMWRNHVRSDDVLVEELVECRGRPSYDWKVYAFRGEIALIVQMDRLGGTKRLRCYLPDWSPAHHVFEGRYDRSDPLDSPTMPDELLRAASTLSSILPIPFVRADLYASDNQVLVGELTPFPGTAHEHSPTWDRILGEAWERGEAALRAAGLPRYQLPQPQAPLQTR